MLGTVAAEVTDRNVKAAREPPFGAEIAVKRPILGAARERVICPAEGTTAARYARCTRLCRGRVLDSCGVSKGDGLDFKAARGGA